MNDVNLDGGNTDVVIVSYTVEGWLLYQMEG